MKNSSYEKYKSFDFSTPMDYSEDSSLDNRMKFEYYSQERATKEETIEQLKVYHTLMAQGKKKEANEIIKHLVLGHIHLAVTIVYKFFKDETKRRDTVQEMYFYINNALRTYDEGQGAAPATYIAATIRTACKGIYAKERFPYPIKVPTHLLGEAQKAQKFYDAYLAENEKYPSDDVVMAKFNYSKKRWTEIKKVMDISFVSIDATSSIDDDAILAEVIPDDYDIMDDVHRCSISHLIDTILVNRNVPERTIKMIRYCYGFEDGVKHSFGETGQWVAQFNLRHNEPKALTAERVRQEITKALSALAEELNKRGICSVIDY